MKVYISGPMSGYPNKNEAAFEAAHRYLESCGHTVFNPVRNNIKRYGSIAESEKLATYREVLQDDLNWIMKEADALYMLGDWRKSKGAKLEHSLAVLIGLPIYGHVWG